MESNIIFLDYKVGTKFTNEDLNTEFKKFTLIDRKISGEYKRHVDNFFENGTITNEFQDFLLLTLEKYIESYVPKYTGCFFNSDNFFNNLESYFYIGIDDNGTISGIPCNSQIINYYDLLLFINNNIKKYVGEKIKNNIIPFNEILECIEAQILVLNKNENEKQKIKSKLHQEKLKEYSGNIDKLIIDLDNETNKKNEMDLLFSSLATDVFKTNRIIPDKLINIMIMQKDFPINDFNKNNKSQYEYILDCMTKFDTKSYVVDYEKTIEKRNYQDYINSERYTLELSTYIHEYVKNMLGRLRDRLKTFGENSNLKIKEIRDLYNISLGNHDNLYYDFSTYYDKIIKHEENNHIIIRIKFKKHMYDKFINARGTFDKNEILLSYEETNKKGDKILSKSKRTLKYLKDKLDPECQKI
jgi:hypothetical protein